MTIDFVPSGESIEFSDTLFLLRVRAGIGRYAGSPVCAGHSGTRDYSRYHGKFDRADIWISQPKTAEDHDGASIFRHPPICCL